MRKTKTFKTDRNAFCVDAHCKTITKETFNLVSYVPINSNTTRCEILDTVFENIASGLAKYEKDENRNCNAIEYAYLYADWNRLLNNGNERKAHKYYNLQTILSEIDEHVAHTFPKLYDVVLIEDGFNVDDIAYTYKDDAEILEFENVVKYRQKSVMLQSVIDFYELDKEEEAVG